MAAMPPAVPGTRAVVVVPIRGFREGKSRLSGAYAAGERAEMMESMAAGVVAAAHAAGCTVVVVSSAPEVEAWAAALGMTVIADPGSLDAAAAAGRAWARACGARRVVVAHADLPLVSTLEALTAPDDPEAAVVVPCHRDDGTPLLSLPLPAAGDFAFAYGPGSFARHVAEAQRCGLAVTELLDDPALRFDVDSPADLDRRPGLRR